MIEQKFDEVESFYDREGDVLYISFGPPVPSVGVVVEDWLVIRVTPNGRRLSGLTLIGFKQMFSKVRPELIAELPERIERLRKARFVGRYIEETDTLTIRFEEDQPAYFEPFDKNIYLERALLEGHIIGFKFTHYTEQGFQLFERLAGAILDALFAPAGAPPGPADALTRAFIEHLDLPQLLRLAA